MYYLNVFNIPFIASIDWQETFGAFLIFAIGMAAHAF
jgi:hypothetical protein